MEASIWSSCIGHILMATYSWLFCHFIFTNVILTKIHPYRVSIGLITCTFPQTINTFCHSFVPRPHPALCRLQYAKAMESWAGPGNDLVLSSISESHGSPKINFIVLKVKAHKW